MRGLHAHAERLRASGGAELPPAGEALRLERAGRASAGSGADGEWAPQAPTDIGPTRPNPRSLPGLENRIIGASQATNAVAPLDRAERQRALDVLAEQVAGCTTCKLCRTRKQAVFARGDGSSGLCFVGEGPGADEDQQGYPFVGAAGQLLDRMIGAMGLTRDEVYVCNVVKCRPPENRKPEPDEMAACMPFLQQQLELVAPSVIVALGATAAQALLGTSIGILKLRGKWRLYRGRIAVMPTFHPAYLLRKPEAKREAWQDLQAVLTHLGRSAPKSTKV